MSKPNFARWDEILAKLKSGALGDENSPTTLLKYWQMQESAGYPSANENVKYFEELVEKERKMKYQYPNGQILTKEELREIFVKCNPQFRNDDVEFEVNLYIGIQNGDLKEVEECENDS